MKGNIDFGGGNDRYEAQGSGTVDGEILGGDGDDLFYLGSSSERIDRGEGKDQIVNASATGARISLSDDRGTGVADGDTYAGIERVVGSKTGADQLIAGSNGEILDGRGGDDRLEGRAGSNYLVGGAGTDKLIGGDGSDRFVCNTLEDAGDVILDFQSDDEIRVDASEFGAGLTAGALASSRFYASSTGKAHDADDRFILNTGNKQLMFDPDGTGKAAAILLADLQSDASLGIAYIVLI